MTTTVSSRIQITGTFTSTSASASGSGSESTPHAGQKRKSELDVEQLRARVDGLANGLDNLAGNAECLFGELFDKSSQPPIDFDPAKRKFALATDVEHMNERLEQNRALAKSLFNAAKEFDLKLIRICEVVNDHTACGMRHEEAIKQGTEEILQIKKDIDQGRDELSATLDALNKSEEAHQTECTELRVSLGKKIKKSVESLNQVITENVNGLTRVYTIQHHELVKQKEELGKQKDATTAMAQSVTTQMDAVRKFVKDAATGVEKAVSDWAAQYEKDVDEVFAAYEENLQDLHHKHAALTAAREQDKKQMTDLNTTVQLLMEQVAQLTNKVNHPQGTAAAGLGDSVVGATTASIYCTDTSADSMLTPVAEGTGDSETHSST